GDAVADRQSPRTPAAPAAQLVPALTSAAPRDRASPSSGCPAAAFPAHRHPALALGPGRPRPATTPAPGKRKPPAAPARGAVRPRGGRGRGDNPAAGGPPPPAGRLSRHGPPP